MKLVLLTIVLDGLPFLPRQLEIFQQLSVDWRWLLVEGAADNKHDTKWCQPQEPRLSRDGSTEWINRHLSSRVQAFRKQLWDGKVEMVNTALAAIKEPCVLVQVDADEFWTQFQLERIHTMLSAMPYVKAYFACRYFVGPKIVILPENDLVHNVWLRAWRFTPGDKFASHEPPNLTQQAKGVALTVPDTAGIGLVFDHLSYVYEHQVAYKGAFYGYPKAVEHWQRLQANRHWPAPLKRYLPWAKAGAMATLLP